MLDIAVFYTETGMNKYFKKILGGYNDKEYDLNQI